MMWEWGGAKSFDVTAGCIQDMPSQYPYPWLGEETEHGPKTIFTLILLYIHSMMHGP